MDVIDGPQIQSLTDSDSMLVNRRKLILSAPRRQMTDEVAKTARKDSADCRRLIIVVLRGIYAVLQQFSHEMGRTLTLDEYSMI